MKYTTIFLLLGLMLLGTACQGPEEELVLQEGEIYGPMHQANIGRITFMGDVIPAKEYRAKDFLKSFDLKDEVNFNVRIYLGRTLTAYLHDLAPELTVNELCKKGNYQFSFFVDDSLIYKENLNQGAGSCSFKNSLTLFRAPLISLEEEDIWSRFLWIRFMKKGGGEEALAEGNHSMRIEMRPYVELDEVKVGKIIAQGELTMNVIKKNVSESEIALQPIAENSGWTLSEDGIEETLIREMNKKIAQNDLKSITSIAVIKDGKLLLEEYFNKADRTTLHDTRSVGKTFASAMMGVAIEEGHIKDENASLKEFYDLNTFKNPSPAKEAVTLKSLLTMSSGFEGSDQNINSLGNEEYMYPSPDWVKFALDLPMDESKKMGESWDYFTAGVVVLGDILHQKVPGGLEAYTAEKLFQPLGIVNYQWQYTPQKVANTAGGLQMSTLDYAKFGQLYKNGGMWEGTQVLPEAWVTKSLAQQVSIPREEGGFYGYLFWNKVFEIEGNKYEAAYCSGNGGNKIYVFKELPLVIVVTAQAYGQPYAHFQVDKMMKEYVLPAVLTP